MPRGSAADHLYIGAEKLSLPASIGELHALYAGARPFPHLVIDNLFPAHILEALTPDLPDVLDRRHWALEDSESLIRYNLRSATELGDAGEQLTSFLHSANFLYFLGELTGINNLLPDPYLQGAGYNVMPRGGFFQVHGDRNTGYESGLMRRVAVITYLNKDWLHEYGGQLELWNATGTQCEISIEPVFNRTIMFDTASDHLHGVPTVAGPENRSRRSFLTYFHTVGINGNIDIPAHGTLYAPSYYGAPKMTAKAILRDCVPPFLYRAMRRILRPPK